MDHSETGALDCEDIQQNGRWVVSASLLATVENDLQQIVDCIPEKGELILESSLKIPTKDTIILHHPILVKGEAKGKKRPVITCAKKGTAAIEIL